MYAIVSNKLNLKCGCQVWMSFSILFSSANTDQGHLNGSEWQTTTCSPNAPLFKREKAVFSLPESGLFGVVAATV
jgi:hypothetical protein